MEFEELRSTWRVMGEKELRDGGNGI